MQDSESILMKLQAKLGPLEALRLDTKAQVRRTWLVLVAGLLGGVLGCFLLSYVGGWAVFVGSVATFLALLFTHHKMADLPREKFREQFKGEFIRALLENVTKEVRYVPTGDPLVWTHYQQSELFPKRPDSSSIEDSIFTRVGNIELIASELHTQYESQSTDSEGNSQTHSNTIFNGLFITADLQKGFAGKTIIHPDVAEKTLGKFGRFFQDLPFSDLKLIELDDPEFEKEFVVRSNNEFEARSILTPAFMRRILELRQKLSGDVHLSFLQSRVYLAISTNENFFEPNINQSLTELDTLRRSLDQVHQCLGIVQDLALNPEITARS